MGIAQGLNIFIELAYSLKNRKDLGFLFVGRGSELNKLKKLSGLKKLDNILFFDEIKHEEVPSLLKMCHVGLISLNLFHKSHNIPGKFLTYLQAGLPVLAKINPGTDLQNIIEKEKVGIVYTSSIVNDFRILAEKIMDDEINYKLMSSLGKNLYQKMFSTSKITSKIISSLSEYMK
jgi:glycosyltransferase involved in cell wall biosynthesis